MPTAFSHAALGAALAPLAPRSARGVQLALTLAALAVLPDFDVFGLYLGVPYAHALGHRGFSHSLLFAALAGLCTSALWYRGLKVSPATWWSLAALGFVATASHGLLDALTDAGLGVGFLLPVSNARTFFPWRPLATSPLSPGAIFSARILPVLANELVWIVLPLACIASCVWLARARRVAARTPSESRSRRGAS